MCFAPELKHGDQKTNRKAKPSSTLQDAPIANANAKKGKGKCGKLGKSQNHHFEKLVFL
jgi:hypothetical protein